MKEIDKIRIKQWNQDNPYIQMKKSGKCAARIPCSYSQ